MHHSSQIFLSSREKACNWLHELWACPLAEDKAVYSHQDHRLVEEYFPKRKPVLLPNEGLSSSKEETLEKSNNALESKLNLPVRPFFPIRSVEKLTSYQYLAHLPASIFPKISKIALITNRNTAHLLFDGTGREESYKEQGPSTGTY